jgi:hypothetical protein
LPAIVFAEDVRVSETVRREKGISMTQKFERIEKHLYVRQYQTAGGEWSTIYYAEFTDWQGIRRKFPLGDDLPDARDKLGELRNLNKGRYDWDAEKKKAEEKSDAPSSSLNGANDTSRTDSTPIRT